MLTRKLILAATFILMLASGVAQAGGDAARGEELSVNCADCHGADGKGVDDAPPIAGLDETIHLEKLAAYKSGEGVDEDSVMPMYTEDLSEQDLADLAAYYATLSGS